jgi:hypothetical protein
MESAVAGITEDGDGRRCSTVRDLGNEIWERGRRGLEGRWRPYSSGRRAIESIRNTTHSCTPENGPKMLSGVHNGVVQRSAEL